MYYTLNNNFSSSSSLQYFELSFEVTCIKKKDSKANILCKETCELTTLTPLAILYSSKSS